MLLNEVTLTGLSPNEGVVKSNGEIQGSWGKQVCQ